MTDAERQAVVLVGRQRFEPIGILRLQLAELGDGVLPTPGATAMVGRATGADHRRIGRARDAVTGDTLACLERSSLEGQSRPKPRGGATLSSSERSSSQIAWRASASALRRAVPRRLASPPALPRPRFTPGGPQVPSALRSASRAEGPSLRAGPPLWTPMDSGDEPLPMIKRGPFPCRWGVPFRRRLTGEARKPYPKRFLHRVLLLRFILVVGDLGLLLAVLETPQRHGLGHFLAFAHDHDVDRPADGHRGDETLQIA